MPSLLAKVTLVSEQAEQEIEFKVFPNGRGVTVRVARAKLTEPASHARPQEVRHSNGPTGIESSGDQSARETPAHDTLDVLRFNPLHTTLTQIILQDRTDHYDNLVFEQSWLLQPAEERIELSGNVFALENRITQEGLIFVKHAPLPHARPLSNLIDLSLRGEDLAFLGHGASADGAGYASTLLSYSGGKPGRTLALHELQRQIRPYRAGRDGLFISNTWGDRNCDGRISENFTRTEIEAGAKLGVDVVQLDDGWQKGRSANSVNAGGVWESYWDFDPTFWQPHPTRFPNRLKPLVELARAHQMNLGIWFGPDSSNDFANWPKDAELILAMHRELGVTQVKIDSVKARTKTGEENLRLFFDTVLLESQAKVVFDLDVTADIRPGYFGMMNVGTLFIENRYTDWHRYWPHHTLRNFWQLSQYIDPIRLRMEFLNTARNTHLYSGDPLAPANYPADYLFASVMFGSPLGWFETSGLSPEFITSVASLVSLWKQHREAIYTNQTFPIGLAPDGTQWTGFLNCAPDHRSGYILLFRELNNQSHHVFTLPLPTNSVWETKVIAGSGDAKLNGNTVSVEIPESLRYLWLHFQQV